MIHPFWSVHTHSRYSAKDAMSDIPAMVKRAHELGYPALGLTDHGTMAGAVQFYLACRKTGVSPLPGCEFYFTPDHGAKNRASTHLTVVAYTETGYRNLVKLTTLANENFFNRPRLDAGDLAMAAETGLTEGLALGTGCRSGLVVKSLVEREDLAAAVRITKTLAGWFERTYVEVMNHGFTAQGASDDEICAALVGIADEVGLPVLVTSDSHYVQDSDQIYHDAMKELLTWAETPEDGRFHGTGYHLVDTDWLAEYLEPAVLARGLGSLAELAEAASVRIPELDTFTLKVPKIPEVKAGADPNKLLADRVVEALTAGEYSDEHYDRAFVELEVIKDVEMPGYLLLVASITDMMTARRIWFHTRGSAAGSLVNYLIGITTIDPVADGIRMDRFLSGDRTTPPDIDLDIQSSRRLEVMEWLRELYPTAQVSVYSHYGLDADAATQTGSLKEEYYSTQRKRGIYLGSEARIPAEDWDMLSQLVSYRLIRHIGTNAAGFLVSDNATELAKIPMVRIGKDSKGGMVTAYDKYDLEPIGIPKIDLLGITMLDAMSIACEYAVSNKPEWNNDAIAFWKAIPRDDPDAMARAGSGNTAGMFQLEGYTQRTGLEDLEPKVTEDIIVAQALFRPGVSKDFLDTYMRRRRGEELVPTVHPDIAKELAPTYGVAIFQEQVVGVLREIGMAPHDLTKMLGAVKASGKASLAKAKAAVAEELPAIITLATARGWSQADINWLESALTDYGQGYSFNKAHSAVYGVFAYNTAWMSVHETLAFWTGVLIAYTGHKNAKKVDVENFYRKEARAFGMKIRLPHVNYSQVDYFPEDPATNTIRTGFRSIPNVGKKAAEAIYAKRGKQRYRSLKDLGERLPTFVSGARDLAMGKAPETLGESTVVYALYKAGALKDLPATHPVKEKPKLGQQALALDKK